MERSGERKKGIRNGYPSETNEGGASTAWKRKDVRGDGGSREIGKGPVCLKSRRRVAMAPD